MEVTIHSVERNSRFQFIKDKIGFGEIIDSFEVDKGHKNGIEIHKLSTTGCIFIYNKRTTKLITVLIARPHQILRYYEQSHKKITPQVQNILQLAFEHKNLGYNNM